MHANTSKRDQVVSQCGEVISNVTENEKYVYLKGLLSAVKFFLSKIHLNTKHSKMSFALAHEKL